MRIRKGQLTFCQKVMTADKLPVLMLSILLNNSDNLIGLRPDKSANTTSVIRLIYATVTISPTYSVFTLRDLRQLSLNFGGGTPRIRNTCSHCKNELSSLIWTPLCQRSEQIGSEGMPKFKSHQQLII